MFKTVASLGYSDGKKKYSFIITDTEFQETVEVLIPINIYNIRTNTIRFAAIITAYRNHGNLYRNVILYINDQEYTLLREDNLYSIDLMKNDLAEIGRGFPELKFGIKDYHCLVNEIEKIKWSGIRK